MNKYRWILAPAKGYIYEALSAKTAAEYLGISRGSLYFHWKTNTPIKGHLVHRLPL